MTTVVSGSLFRLGGAPIAAAIEATILDALARGEELVKVQLTPGHGVDTGTYRAGVLGELISSRHGEVHDSEAIQGTWLEGTSSRNKTTRFKGYAMFRQARQQLERETDGFLKKRIRDAVGRLN